MQSFLAVFQRELRAYFYSPMAWIVLTFFLIIQGIIISLIVGFLADPRASAEVTPFNYFFSSFFFWFTQLFITPVITMRLVAEERRSGTLESLMTAPVSENQVVTAKFTAALSFFAFLWLPTLAYPILIGRHTEVDWGPLASGYLGTLGIGAVSLAAGMFGSSFTKNQIVAAVGSFGILMLLFIVPWADGLFQDPLISNVLGYINWLDHMEDFSRGIVDTRRLVYYFTTTALFLFLTGRAIEAKKWQ